MEKTEERVSELQDRSIKIIQLRKGKKRRRRNGRGGGGRGNGGWERRRKRREGRGREEEYREKKKYREITLSKNRVLGTCETIPKVSIWVVTVPEGEGREWSWEKHYRNST